MRAAPACIEPRVAQTHRQSQARILAEVVVGAKQHALVGRTQGRRVSITLHAAPIADVLAPYATGMRTRTGVRRLLRVAQAAQNSIAGQGNIHPSTPSVLGWMLPASCVKAVRATPASRVISKASNTGLPRGI